MVVYVHGLGRIKKVEKELSMPLEQWQEDILIRDWLDAKCLVGKLAYMLYPETLMTRDRERRFLH